MKFRLIFILLSLCTVIITGCRESAQPTAEATDIHMTLTVDPTPAKVGDAALLITITDSTDHPIDVQKLTVRGDMTHAGMVPVMGEEAIKTDEGYRVPFAWSMGGDWIVTVEATLNDGQVVSQEFEFTVES